ncbi:glycosyltransferase [Pectobacterium brasiliense]|uniref:tetratricopeptide repeat-containing glycosyltransferase family 2 protein n=1 Tax=Pectobacterium brasiliense TaxID=180957 RepID=UPI00196904F7|nr:glycosyltransferase [Pectobacterium brasiliense]MBN3115068.1 glycosyltransferase [Pectobacterium brasiliense]
MISVCMIVKNEALHLGNSLKAIAKYFDDIVVVDTGSTDDSKSIAKKFTDKVYDFEWISDFSAARNYSLQFAKYDWVLVIDADEEIESIDIAMLSKLIHQHTTHIGNVERLDYIDEDGEESIVKECFNRLFRKELYHYEGIIHEQITPREIKSHAVKRFMAPIVLNHIGYQQEVLRQTNKIARNISMLEKAIGDTPKEPYLHYQLGKSHYLNKDYLSAIKSFSIALELQENAFPTYNENLIECYGYSLINIGEYVKSLDILKYEKYCSSTDFIFLKALVLMNNSDFQGALDHFQKCINMPSGRKSGVNSYKANHNIAVILECHNMLNEAVTFYKKCGNYPPAQAGIARILK